MKRLVFLGHGRSGKDEALIFLSTITPLRNAGTTSKYLTKHVAARLGVSEEQAYAERHANRKFWYDVGNEIREGDPTLLLREAFEHGELTGGLRDIAEVVGCREEGLCDLMVWVERPSVPPDPTVTFGPEHCDLVIRNDGTLDEYRRRLRRLAEFGGLT